MTNELLNSSRHNANQGSHDADRRRHHPRSTDHQTTTKRIPSARPGPSTCFTAYSGDVPSPRLPPSPPPPPTSHLKELPPRPTRAERLQQEFRGHGCRPHDADAVPRRGTALHRRTDVPSRLLRGAKQQKNVSTPPRVDTRGVGWPQRREEQQEGRTRQRKARRRGMLGPSAARSCCAKPSIRDGLVFNDQETCWRWRGGHKTNQRTFAPIRGTEGRWRRAFRRP